MKKYSKILIGVLISSLLVAGTGYAAVKKFKGFQIVNVTVNGSTYNGDVPAVLVDGKVWVSAKVADKMGGKSTYNKSTNKLTITKTDDKAILKAYGEIASYYDDLESLGEQFSLIGDFLDSSFDDINKNNDLTTLNETDTKFESIINSYNNLIDKSLNFKKLAIKHKVNVDDIDDILNNYYDAIDSYKLTSKSLRDFAAVKNDQNFNNELKNYDNFRSYIFDGKYGAKAGKTDFLNMIIKY